MNVLRAGLVKALRTTGQQLDNAGKFFEACPYEEKLLPSTHSVKFGKFVPESNALFISSSATVVGNVKIGRNSSVFYGSSIRGDQSEVSIGDNVFVGDRVCINGGLSAKAKYNTKIGNNVIIEPGASISGATIENNVIVGAGSQILQGAVLQKQSVLSPGSVVLPNVTIPTGQLWSGNPAVYERHLMSSEVEAIDMLVQEQVEIATQHSIESKKNWMEIEEDEFEFEQKNNRDDFFFQRLSQEELENSKFDYQGHRVPGRIFDSKVRAAEVNLDGNESRRL